MQAAYLAWKGAALQQLSREVLICHVCYENSCRSAHVNECVQEQVLVQLLQARDTGFGVLCPIDLSRQRGRRARSGGKEQPKVSADADGKVLACSNVPSSLMHPYLDH